MRKTLLNLMGVLMGTLIVVCFCGCGKGTAHYLEGETEVSQQDEIEQEESASSQTEIQEERLLYVYVCGQVKNPGVYTLPEGSRIYDVFSLAGGFTEFAATDYWNQARLLKDGEMIYVPSREETQGRPIEEAEGGKTQESGKVNINTASKEELMTLPGIGEVKALAILAYRQEHGSFSTLEELKQVEGIKDAVFIKIKAYIEI